jgi:spore germination cell wall hydrolase CwlJ-like protein
MLKLILSLVLVLFPLSLKAIDKEFECLAKNVYYESRGEPHKGQLAVALVTLNRVEDPRYPKSICGVVYQKHQFSWTKNYKLQRLRVNQDQWKKAREVAMQAYMDRDILGNFDATHFHNASVSPGWKLRRVARINNHTFYM